MLGIAIAAMVIFAVGCGKSPESELSGTWYVQARFGKWLPLDVTEMRTFEKGGTLVISRSDMDRDHKVSWSVVGEWRMRITPPDTSDVSPLDVLYRIEGDTLTLADDSGETVLTREKGPSEDRKAAWESLSSE